MNTVSTHCAGLGGLLRRLILPACLAAIGFSVLGPVGCTKQQQAQTEKQHIDPVVFATPEEAVQSLMDALRADDLKRLLAIMGTDGEEIIFSGDDVADRNRREKFLALYNEKHSIAKDEKPDAMTLVVGKSDWPFPVPIVKDEKGLGWYFDSDEGKQEILNRRIGENELSAIQVCKAIADAQREYAMRDPESTGAHEYAQKFPSDPGRRNGLYWPAKDGEEPSPLGEFAAQASAEGYKRKAEGPTPYHGYYYRILTAQGPAAPGGALSYIVNGKMILGFAVVAYPSDYGNSGIMTFMMGTDGVVYQKDLGDETENTARLISAFDPGEGWKKAEGAPAGS